MHINTYSPIPDESFSSGFRSEGATLDWRM